MEPRLPDDLAPDASRFDSLLDLEFQEVSGERVVVRMVIQPKHHQPYGIVHGGVYCAIAESAASVGGAKAVERWGKASVGQSNHTDFLKGIGSGTITATATPIHVGRSVQLWEVEMVDQTDTMVAQSKVRLFNIDVPR